MGKSPNYQPDYYSLKTLAEERLKEAHRLFDSRLYSGAYYISGYVIEFALKAYYCKQMRFPPKDTSGLWIHDLKSLFLSCGLGQEIVKEMSISPKLGANYGTVCNWSEESRYRLHNEKEAGGLLSAIDDDIDGIYTWIIKRI